MAENRDLLVEIGTEELPPKALATLSRAFGRELCAQLDAAGLTHGEALLFATPRRLAVLVPDVLDRQPDRDVERRGPPRAQAFDESGAATKAALGFARSVGVEVDQLETFENDDGSWLMFRSTELGAQTPALVPGLVNEALSKLPIPRRMRWGDGDIEFVRPVHWVVALFGSEIIDGEMLGCSAGRITRGHRFHHPEGIPVDEAASYAVTLYGSGHVVAEFDARREMIREQVTDLAKQLGGRVLLDEELLDENTALVEWPVALAGSFDESFLELPDPVLIATMKGHQRYFSVLDDAGALLPHFIAISNIESRNPDTVREGNERVIRPRLADARFFFDADAKQTLAQRQEGLKDVVFQRKLGSLHDKAQRVGALAGVVAIAMGQSPDAVKLVRRAGLLSKCDLVTEMVGEFPELQGQMGREYAKREGEPAEVADAIGETYLPRYAGDAIPATPGGRAVAIADKLDTLVGIFGVGLAPTGDKDPYALRRAALGALRIAIEGELNLDLKRMIQAAVDGFSGQLEVEGVAEDVRRFMSDRLRAYFVDQGIPVDVFTAVEARGVTRPHDFARRIEAVDAFRKLPEAASLAAANKRIQNILKQAGGPVKDGFDDSLFAEDAEWNLAAMLVGLGPRAKKMLNSGDYRGALTALAGLRDNVDLFFDTVKVMDDDERVRGNRLALLKSIGALFMETADISQLQIERD